VPHSLGLLINIKLIDVNLHEVPLGVILRDSCGAEAYVAAFLQVGPIRHATPLYTVCGII